MRNIILVLMLALAACSGSAKKKADAAASSTPGRHKGIACTGFPDFVGLPPDAVVDTCHNGDATAFHVTGKIVLETDLAPKDAVAFFKEKANKAGLPDGIADTNPDHPMYTAVDSKTVRSVQVVTEKLAAGGTHVTLDWAKENWDAQQKATTQRNSGGD